MKRKNFNPKEIELFMDDDLEAMLNMMSEGSPDFTAFEEDEEPAEFMREEAKAKDLH